MYNRELIETIKKKTAEPDLRREKYFGQYQLLAPPTPKLEDWRYTSLDFAPEEFHPTEQKTEFSQSEGVIFTDMKTAFREHRELIEKHMPMSIAKAEDRIEAMHAAFWDQGVFIYVPKNKKAELKNKFTVTGKGGIMSHTLIILEENAELDYIEEHYSEKGHYTALRNDAVEVYTGDNSRLRFHSYRNWHGNVRSISTWKAKTGKDAKADWFFAQFGGSFSRIKIDSLLDGEGSSSETYGLFYGKKEQAFDFTTDIHHNVPHTTGNILVKGVLDDKSTSVYRGMIKILKEAQDTNSYLSDHTLLLSDNAVSNSIPSLEIDANEVSASHGATLGKPDEEEIFYIMSRGLDREESTRMVIKGFFSGVTEKIKSESFKEKIEASIGD